MLDELSVTAVDHPIELMDNYSASTRAGVQGMTGYDETAPGYDGIFWIHENKKNPKIEIVFYA